MNITYSLSQPLVSEIPFSGIGLGSGSSWTGLSKIRVSTIEPLELPNDTLQYKIN